jgi:hypothetical protein
VIAVVWKGRLLLFWLRILQQAPVDPSALPTSNDETSLADMELKTLTEDAKSNAQNSMRVTVQAVLCWSEYYNGKWQPTKTSDVNRPARLGQFAPGGSDAFDRSNLRLSVKEGEGILRVVVAGEGVTSFVLYNTHSLPVISSEIVIDLRLFERSRGINTWSDTLEVFYSLGDGHWDATGYFPGTVLSRQVLKNNISDRVVEPLHKVNDPWIAPFFYEDSRHVFFATAAGASRAREGRS